MEFLSHAATVVALGLSAIGIYIAARAIELDKARSDLAAATRSQDIAESRARDAESERHRQEQLAAAAEQRVSDLRQAQSQIGSQLATVQAELQARLHDVVDAREELQRVTRLATASDVARQAAVRRLVDALTSAYVVAHLGLAHRELAGADTNPTMLREPGDHSFAGVAWFEAEPRDEQNAQPSNCALGDRFMLIGTDNGNEVDMRQHAGMRMVCDYLNQPTGYVRFGQAIRSMRGQPGPNRTLSRWEDLGNDGPFRLSILSLENYEETEIREFWSGIEISGMMSGPGLSLALDRGNDAVSTTATLVNQRLADFRRDWVQFIASIRNRAGPSSGDTTIVLRPFIQSSDLRPITRASPESFRNGRVETTERFNRALLCAAAVFARRRGVIEGWSQITFCAQ
jgi:hypothetical protein